MADTAARLQAGENAAFLDVLLKDCIARYSPKAIPNEKGHERTCKQRENRKLLADEKFVKIFVKQIN